MTVERLADTLSRHRVDERERALRAILMRPLMTGINSDFSLVRRHADFLRGWLAREAGWVLHIERDSARLYKRPADTRDATRGAPGFDRRRYALLCLACAVLERADPQITLKTLGERLLGLSTDPALAQCGFAFTLEQAHERRELVHVCRYLMELGVLQRVAGEEESYVQQGGDALYDVHRRTLAGMLAGARGASSFIAGSDLADLEERIAALLDEYEADSVEGRRMAVRHRLTRRLLDDPIVYFDELSEEERDYFANQRGAIAERLRLATGLKPEQRAEGMALVDPDGEVTDAALPAEGTEAHATLLVAEFLAERQRQAPELRIDEGEVAVFVRSAADRYARYWRKSSREPGAERELAQVALERLCALKLVSVSEGRVAARPALARFAIGEPAVRPSVQPPLIHE
jgi:uncharacterized protein (TIGR02678 family)